MPNFNNSKIYKLTSSQTPLCYIGSTTTSLNARYQRHKSHYGSYIRGTGKYLTAVQILKFPDVQITLVEEFPCNTKAELHVRERYYVDNTPCVNQNLPTRTQADWYRDHRTMLLSRQNQYYQDNKTERIAYQRQYNKKNAKKLYTTQQCPCGGKFQKATRSQHNGTNRHVDWFNANA